MGIFYYVSVVKSGIVLNIDIVCDYVCFCVVLVCEWWKELRVLWKLVRLVLKVLFIDVVEFEGFVVEVYWDNVIFYKFECFM